MTREELLAALLVERFGPLERQAPRPVEVDNDLARARRRRVLRTLPPAPGRYPKLRRVS